MGMNKEPLKSISWRLDHFQEIPGSEEILTFLKIAYFFQTANWGTFFGKIETLSMAKFNIGVTRTYFCV